MPYKLDLKHKKFGKLEILEESGQDAQRNYLWKCKCDCGKFVVRSAAQIMKFKNSNQACSTGCSQKLEKGETALNILYNHKYKSSADKRGLEFALDRDQFIKLIKGNCFYCGSSPKAIIKDLVYNGIDRIDNKKGYLPKNCISCCKKCNRMKLDLDQKDFIRTIKLIAAGFN